MMLPDVMLVCLCVCVHADMTRAHVYLKQQVPWRQAAGSGGIAVGGFMGVRSHSHSSAASHPCAGLSTKACTKVCVCRCMVYMVAVRRVHVPYGTCFANRLRGQPIHTYTHNPDDNIIYKTYSYIYT